MVKELRERTGVGFMDCKKALEESSGDSEKAIVLLREKGQAKAEKKAMRTAKEGLVHAYIHPPGKVGVLLEINCESDFVARNSEFVELARDIAMHIAAMSPLCVRREELPENVVARERDIFRKQVLNEGKPERVLDRIVEGKLEKFFQESCLLEQVFVKNPDYTIEQLIKEKIAKLGENISVARFSRFRVGEAIGDGSGSNAQGS